MHAPMKSLLFLLAIGLISAHPCLAQNQPASTAADVSIDFESIAVLKSTPALKTLSTGGRLPILDGKKTKLWLSTILKGSALNPHRHLVGRWIIPLEDAVIYKHYNRKSGKQVAKMEWKRGEIYYYPADEEDVYHNDENHSDKPVQVLVLVLHEEGVSKVAEEMPATFDEMDYSPIESAKVDPANAVMPSPEDFKN